MVEVDHVVEQVDVALSGGIFGLKRNSASLEWRKTDEGEKG